MIELPYIKLPQNYLKLLRVGVQNLPGDIEKIDRFISGDKTLVKLVNRTMSEFSTHGDIRSIISALGWRRFRDRLASVYLQHRMRGIYPLKSELDLISDIVKFEEHYREFAVSGSSRVFMLGLYIKFYWIESGELRNVYDGDSDLEMNVYNLLKLNTHKTLQLDWLILILWHFIDYMGFDQLANIIKKSKSPYFELYGNLSGEQKENMMSNMLAYGQSIDEPNIFTQVHV